MKKLLLAFPIVALLAAGCNSTQQASVQTPVVQQPAPVPTTTTPKPAPQAAKTPTPAPAPVSTPPQTSAPTIALKTVVNNSPNFSIGIPQDDKLEVDAQVETPINYRYAIENSSNEELAAPINIQMHAGESSNGTSQVEDLPDFFLSNEYSYASFIKPFTTSTGLKGMIYNDPNPNSDGYFEEAVVIPYPNSSSQNMQPSASVQLQYPLLEIAMDGSGTQFTSDEQNLFMAVVNSLKFTSSQP